MKIGQQQVISKLFTEVLHQQDVQVHLEKRYVREANGLAKDEVYNLSTPSTGAHQSITFTNEDLRGMHIPHDDALVILATIGNFNIQRIQVDNMSLTNILFILAFNEMRIG